MDILVALYLFFIGLCFGSFALAMVDRMKAGKDWVKGRSQCEYCHKSLQVRDLIPLVSWLSTGGKCRFCHKRLSPSYPLTELLTGTLFAFSFVFWPYELNGFINIASFILWLAALIVLVALLVFDVRWFLLPNKLVYPLIGMGALWAVLRVADEGSSGLLGYIPALAVSAGFFLVLYLISKGKWIGDGDIRLGVAMGLFLGTWEKAWLAIFLASLLGIILSMFTLAKKKPQRKLKMKIPFGPALIVALYLTMLFGQRIIDWYTSEILLL